MEGFIIAVAKKYYMARDGQAQELLRNEAAPGLILEANTAYRMALKGGKSAPFGYDKKKFMACLIKSHNELKKIINN